LGIFCFLLSLKKQIAEARDFLEEKAERLSKDKSQARRVTEKKQIKGPRGPKLSRNMRFSWIEN
jgi:hypothetical protein